MPTPENPPDEDLRTKILTPGIPGWTQITRRPRPKTEPNVTHRRYRDSGEGTVPMAGLEPTQLARPRTKLPRSQSDAVLPPNRAKGTDPSGLLLTQSMAPCLCPAIGTNKKAAQRAACFVGADGRTRTGTALATAPSRQRVYQFHHIGKYCWFRRQDRATADPTQPLQPAAWPAQAARTPRRRRRRR